MQVNNQNNVNEIRLKLSLKLCQYCSTEMQLKIHIDYERLYFVIECQCLWSYSLCYRCALPVIKKYFITTFKCL